MKKIVEGKPCFVLYYKHTVVRKNEIYLFICLQHLELIEELILKVQKI